MYKDDKIAYGLFLVVFGLFFFVSLGFPDDVSKYPYMVSSIGTILCVIALINVFIKEKKARQQENKEVEDKKKRLDKDQINAILITSSFVIIYVIIIPIIGYTVSTFMFLFALMFALKKSKIWVYLVTSIVFSGSIYVIFYMGLNVALPQGLLF